jgi:NADH dehydrogenase [ubiquinone] 1 alpha subcomplex assembly factor 5
MRSLVSFCAAAARTASRAHPVRRRALSSSSPDSMMVFNRRMKIAQRDRAAAAPDSREYDYLRDEVARRLVERLGDILREFPTALDLGANTGNIAAALRAATPPPPAAAAEDGSSSSSPSTSAPPSHGGIRTLHMLEPSHRMLYRDEALWSSPTSPFRVVPHAVADLEGPSGLPLPFPTASLDLVLSSLALHWVNDLPGLFKEVRRVLKPDGVFLAAMLGGETLQELRDAFYEAEMKRSGGVSPHLSPMAGVGDVGNLLSGAGFGLPTVDADTFTIGYPSPQALYRHLRGMGESNAALGMRGGIHRALLQEAADVYDRDHRGTGGMEKDEGVPATFQVIFLVAWSPAPTQPLPKLPGSVPKGFGMRKGKGSKGEGPDGEAAAGAAAAAAEEERGGQAKGCAKKA